MGNASEVVPKAKADYITYTNNDDGLPMQLKDLSWKEERMFELSRN